MNKFVTIVIKMPVEDDKKLTVRNAFKSLEPFQTGMALDDEMTVLEMIEQHEDFDENIAIDARKLTKELHLKMEQKEKN